MLLSYAPIPLLCLCDPPMLFSMFHPINICSFLMPPPMPSPIILCQILKVLMAYRYLQRGKHLIYAPMSTPMHWCLILCPSPCPSHAFFLCYVWLVCFTNTEKIACTSADTWKMLRATILINWNTHCRWRRLTGEFCTVNTVSSLSRTDHPPIYNRWIVPNKHTAHLKIKNRKGLYKNNFEESF